MGQADLGSFDGDRDGDASAEAAAVAGDGDVGDGAAVVDPAAERFGPADGTLSLGVTQVDYTVEGYGDDERPIVHVFGRDPSGDAVHVRVHEFRPYFYAPTASLGPGDLEHDAITGSEEGYESIRGEELTRIYGRTPRDVGQIRDRFEHYEADILFPNRFLIDKDVRSGLAVPDRRNGDGEPIDVHHEEVAAVDADADNRVLTVDIEVDDRRGFPEDGEEPILCLTTHDSYDDEYVAWIFESPEGTGTAPDGLEDYEFVQDRDATVEVRRFETEPAMLAALLDYVEATDPDVTTGWNVDDFDAPYLIDRLQELEDAPAAAGLDLDYDRLSRVNEVWADSDWSGPTIKGRVLLDLLDAYRRTKFTELDSYRLDAVGEQELGVGKERYPGDIGDLWEDDPERLLEYNVRDVELCVEIDRQQQVIPFWEEVADFVGCKLEDAPTPGDTVDMYVLHKAYGRFVLPSKGQQDAEDFEGGAVFDPISGIRDNVAVLDLASLYPMSMSTMNASPETKVDPEVYDGESYVAPNGQHFQKSPDGIMREMIDELLAERDEKKALRDQNEPGTAAFETYDRQQGAVKVLMNSLYGVSGWDRFRLYDKESAAAITATGRAVIEFTETAANELSKQVTYGDTDSVMLELGDVPQEEAIEEAFTIEDHINDRYGEFAAERLNADAHRFEIEFEKLYRRFFQAGKKKRYAGHIVWKEGKTVDDIDIVGFEYQRSDIAEITKEVQLEVIDRIVRSEADVDAVVEDVTGYVREVIEEFESGDVDLEAIAIPGGIGKRLDNYDTDTAHVRGSKYANLLLGTNIDRGDKPKRLYLEKVHPDYFARIEAERGLDPAEDPLYGAFKRDPDVICFEYADQVPEAFRVDREKMLDRTLEGPISRILEALDLSWDEVRTGQEQTGLGGFM